MASFLPFALADIVHLWPYAEELERHVDRFLQPSVTHLQYHVVAPFLGLAFSTLLLGTAVALGPYLRGERWAAWALALASAGYISAKAWGSVVLFPHWDTEVVPSLLAWIAAVGLSVWDASVNHGDQSRGAKQPPDQRV